jgi:ferredoxin
MNTLKTSKYNNLIVYYFSGTGNALKASEWLIEKAKEYGISTSLHSIDRFENIEKPVTDNKTLIAFCFPTHGFNAAPLMLKFLRKFPKGKADVLILNTRGGLKFKKIYFPGLSGLAQLYPMLLMTLKGYRIAGGLPFDLPSNWVSFHPGLTKSAVNDIMERRKEQLYKFADSLYENGRAYSYKFFVYMPLDIAIVPVMVGYFLFGRIMLSKMFYASADCNDCRLCVDNCPTKSLKIVNGRPFWSYTCENCMRCMNTCPKKSIQTAHSFAIPLQYLFSFIPVTTAIYYLINVKTGEGKFEEFIWSYVNAFYKVALVIITYRIFSYLLKIKFINRIFEYTSLTRYWRRYMAPGVNVKKFHN